MLFEKVSLLFFITKIHHRKDDIYVFDYGLLLL